MARKHRFKDKNLGKLAKGLKKAKAKTEGPKRKRASALTLGHMDVKVVSSAIRKLGALLEEGELSVRRRSPGGWPSPYPAAVPPRKKARPKPAVIERAAPIIVMKARKKAKRKNAATVSRPKKRGKTAGVARASTRRKGRTPEIIYVQSPAPRLPRYPALPPRAYPMLPSHY